MAAEVHPTAVVHPGTVLGDGVRVLEYAVVGKQPVLSPRSTAKREKLPPAEIGDGAVISTGAVVFAGTTVGARAIVVAIPQALEAGQIIRHARAANPAIAVLARGHSDEEVTYLLAAGADAAVMGEREIARSMCESIDGLARWFQRRPEVVASDVA